MKYTGKW